MKRSQLLKNALFLLFILLFVACEKKPEDLYLSMEKRELASGKRYDDLFAGLYLGMTRENFRAHSLDMHIEKQFNEGGQKSASWVEYRLEDELKYPGAINFYPEFVNDRISEMRSAIYYDVETDFGEEGFNKNELLQDVLNMLERWYNVEFIKIESPVDYKDDIYVNVKGNRRITVYNDGDSFSVSLWYVDLNALKKEE